MISVHTRPVDLTAASRSLGRVLDHARRTGGYELMAGVRSLTEAPEILRRRRWNR